MYVSIARHHRRRAPKILLSNMKLNVDILGTIGVEDHFNCWRGIRASQMDNVVEYNRRGAITNAVVGSGSGGGGVDDILKRLGNVETHVSELRTQVSAISATVPHLATAVSVARVESQVAGILAIIPHLATKADLAATKADLQSDLADVKTAIAAVETKVVSKETAIIKWVIATGLTTAALAFTIAKLVH